MKSKLFEWIKRYLPPFLVATLFTLLFSNLAVRLIENAILVAYIGAWGGIISYYIFIFIRELRSYYKKEKIFDSKLVLKVFRNLFFEFTPAEILDIIIIGPLFLFIFPKLFTNFNVAILLGKLSADVVFYTITICFYELRKKIWF